MSSEQSLDPQLIEQTKQQIRSLVNEIAQFAKTDMAPEEFYGEFLPRVVSALAAIGGVVWARDDQGRLALQYQVNLQETGLATKDEEEQRRHGRLLQKVMTTGDGLLMAPRSGAGEEDQGGNPTDHLLVLGPLKTELEVVGVVEIFQRCDAGLSTQKGYLRFLIQMCDLAGDFLKSRQLRNFSDRQVLWTQLEEFTRLIHASLNPREAAYTIANEGRRLIECDRVSVAIRKGNKCKIESISGQDLFDKRSNTVRLLNKVATVVVASDEPVWYTGDTRDMAPQVENAIQEYVDESHTKALAVLPLRRPVLIEKEKERPDDPDDAPPAIGALIVEQIEDSRVPQKMMQRVEVVCQHSSTAMANALEHENLFLMPVWRTLGKTRVLTHARTLPKVLLGVAAAIALIVAMIVVPMDFKPRSEGIIVPVQRRDVFAEVEGVVEEVLVKHADLVAAGQPLVRLRNEKLKLDLDRIEGEWNTTRQEVMRLTAALSNRRDASTTDQEIELHGKLQEQKTKLQSLNSQLEILRKQVSDLTVRSPVAGQVISWDLYNKISQRPVQRGQVLVRIADAESAWQLELHMAEDRMGHVAQAQAERYASLREKVQVALRERWRDEVRAEVEPQVRAQQAQAGASNSAAPQPAPPADSENAAAPPNADDERQTQEAELQKQIDAEVAKQLDAQVQTKLDQLTDEELRPVLFELTGEDVEDRLPAEYFVATDPGTRHSGWVREIHRHAEVRGDEGNTVLIKVDIDRNDLRPEDLRQGTTVNAKIACGRCTLGYWLFGDVLTWVEKLWFRWY